VKSLPDVAEQARRLPAKGLLVFRWLTIVWIIVLAATGSAGQYRPLVTWGAIGVLVVWTAWVSRRQSLNDVELVIDLTLGVGVILVAGIAARPGGIDSGPSLAAYYPLCAVTAWGLARGPGGGILAGAVLTVALAAARLLNATSPVLFQGRHVAALANAAIGYLIAGVVIGGFSRSASPIASSTAWAVRSTRRENPPMTTPAIR